MIKYRKINESKFLTSTLLLVGGTSLAELINILASPIITRLYSPEQYGILTVFTSVLGILSLGSFKYEMAIPIAENDESAVNVAALSFFVLTGYSTIVLFVLFFFNKSFLKLFDAEILSDYIIFIPIGIFLSGLYLLLRQWYYRKKDFKTITRTVMSQSISGNAAKIGFGFIGIGSIGLIIGRILSQSAGIVSFLFKISTDEFRLLKSIKIEKVKSSAKRYKSFPIYQNASDLAYRLVEQLPIVFMTSLYGSETVGLYGLAMTVSSLPMAVVGKSVSSVFFAEAASIGRSNPKKLKNISKKMISKLALLGLAPLITLVFFGPILFSMVFGENWMSSGVFSRMLSVMIYADFVFSPVSRIYEVFEKQKMKLYLNSIRLITIFIIFAISRYLLISSFTTILIYSISMAVMYYVSYIVAQKIMNDQIEKNTKITP